MPNQEMPGSAYAIHKAAFREQKRTPITVSMTTYCEAYMLEMIYRPRPMQLATIIPPSNGHQRVTYENRRI